MRGHACSDAVTVRSAVGARKRGRVTGMISGVMDGTFAALRPSVVGVGHLRVRVVVVVVRRGGLLCRMMTMRGRAPILRMHRRRLAADRQQNHRKRYDQAE